MTIDLSILICSTHTRANNFGRAIQKQVWEQYAELPESYQDRIEILMLTDNKKMMLGHKRNVMVDMAQGRYVQFLDDDDRIAPDMFRAVLDATCDDADVITFLAEVSLNGDTPKICRYSKDFAYDENTQHGYNRLPNHICCTKTELAQRVSYPNIPYGEDNGYAKLLHPLLSTETHIDRVLYFYDYNIETTEAQEHLRNRLRSRQHQQPIVDVVILSNGATDDLRRSTQRTIDTCLSGASSLPIEIVVLEGVEGIGYDRAGVVHMPSAFNYNGFANFGARRGSAGWIMIANNDLIFHDGWLHSLLAAQYPLVSPKCPYDERQSEFVENTTGAITGRHLSGWCFMIKRELWEHIDGFDESVSFWCSDDALIEQVLELGIEPMIVPGATVEHVQSATLKAQPDQDELTWKQLDIFIKKYGKHRLQTHPEYLRWKGANV